MRLLDLSLSAAFVLATVGAATPDVPVEFITVGRLGLAAIMAFGVQRARLRMTNVHQGKAPFGPGDHEQSLLTGSAAFGAATALQHFFPALPLEEILSVGVFSGWFGIEVIMGLAGESVRKILGVKTEEKPGEDK